MRAAGAGGASRGSGIARAGAAGVAAAKATARLGSMRPNWVALVLCAIGCCGPGPELRFLRAGGRFLGETG
eukprot:9792658-Alexandrium_andersonii.AAC.1